MTQTFKCIMDDRSEFAMPNDKWNKAFSLKYPIDRWEEVKEAFRKEVARHWYNRTTPTKFGFAEPWGEEYQNQAELAEQVMYCRIRAALFGLILAEETGGQGKVIAFSGDGATVYSDKEPEKKRFDELFGNNKVKD